MSIIWFEWLIVLTLFFRIGQMAVRPGEWEARAEAADRLAAPGVGIALIGVGLLAPLALALWTSRRASRVALWILAVWVAFLVIGYVVPIFQYGYVLSISAMLNVATLAAYVVAIGAAFSPSARRWFRRGRTNEEIAGDFA